MAFPFPIRIARYHFQLEATTPISLPPYAGSTIRGGFGVALRRVTCALRREDCQGCLLIERCTYAYIFETPPGEEPGILRAYPQAPHPFVIEPPIAPPAVYAPGAIIPVGLILVGRAIEYLPYFIYAFDELGANAGLGKGRGRFRLSAVEQESEPGSFVGIYSATSRTIRGTPPPIDAAGLIGDAPAPAAALIHFATPARLKFEGGLLTIVAEMHVLMRNLLRRISALSSRHCDGSMRDFDYRGVIERSRAVVTESADIKWHDWERWSQRQGTRMNMGGFVGQARYRGDLSEFWPYLKVGEAIHIGKGSSFGLGQYTIEPAE